ncbi:hypothetical protein QFC21_001373 [Naganishia friedmannii]|uniref:Uncharacterized protein n=1 Tax=Naganishia friedmannii TaxID=89922 RepID=A0ACC2W4V7_9TREE|nr:hypothetical protein QFC21_001373 [Naganishia friedmannii]
MSSLSELSDNANQSDLSDAPPHAGGAEENENSDPVSDAHSADSAWLNHATPLKKKPKKTYSKRKNRTYGQNGKSPATSAFREDPSDEDSQPEQESIQEETASKRARTNGGARPKATSRIVPKEVLEAQTTPSKTSARTSKRATALRKREIAITEQGPSQVAEDSNEQDKASGNQRRASVENVVPRTQDVTKPRRGRPPKAVTYAESEAEGDDAAGAKSREQDVGKKQRKTGKATGKKEKNVEAKKVLDDDRELSQASDLTMPPSSPAVPKVHPQSAANASSEEESVSKLKETVQSSPAETQPNEAKLKKTRKKKASAIPEENGAERGPTSTMIPDSELPKSKRKPAATKELASQQSTSSTKPKVTQKKAGKTGGATKPKATTSSAASSPKKTTKAQRNGKAQASAVPTSKQTIEAMYFGSSQPYASGTTMLSDSESSDEDERIKVSRLFDPVKRTPQKRKGKDVEEDGPGKTKKAKKGKEGPEDDALSVDETATESEVDYPTLRRDLDASNGTNVYCKNGRHGLYFVGVVMGFDDLSDLPPAKRKKHKEGLYLIKLPVEEERTFKKRRDEFFTENDEGFATCKLGEAAPEVRDDGQISDARTRVSTPPLPDNYEEEFADLDYVIQLQAIRPHLEEVIRDEYPPAQQRIEKFYRKAKALEFTQWYGNVARHYIDEVFITELTRWALRRELKTSVSEDHDVDKAVPEQPSRPTGSARYEELSDDDRESYVSKVLLNEAIIFIMLKTMKLESLDLETLNAMWADEDFYPDEMDVERKTVLMRDLVARKELDRLAHEEPDAYMSWSVLMEARNQKRLAQGLPLEGEKKPEGAIEERKGRAARSRNAVSYRE